MTEQGKDKQEQVDDKGEEQPKVDVLSLQQELEQARAELKQLRESVLSDDYMRYVTSQAQVQVPEKKDTSIEAMTPTQLAEHITKAVMKQLPELIQHQMYAMDVEKAKRELQALAAEHKDWVNYKAEMRVLSEQHPDWGAKKLYEEAKMWRHPTPLPSSVATEKPFLGSNLFEKEEKPLTSIEAARAAIREVQEKYFKEEGGK